MVKKKYKVFERRNTHSPFEYYASYSTLAQARRSVKGFKRGVYAKIVIETKNKRLKTIK